MGPLSKRGLGVVAALLVLSASLAPCVGRGAEGDARAANERSAAEARDADRMVVHEWGTFTSLQDERGDAIAGINVDDEPVPAFVHRISKALMLGPEARGSIFSKGVPQVHPDVTMRLETPVVYFHPAPGTVLPQTVDVAAAFRGGWLSEYFPDAEAVAPGVTDAKLFGGINGQTVGRLRWQGLRVGAKGDGPQTDSPIWLAPRAVEAANVTAAGGESERYLFYRGVGHVDSPLAVVRDAADDSLAIHVQIPDGWPRGKPFSVRRLWLVDVRDDRLCAFRELPGFETVTDGLTKPAVRTASEFEEADYGTENIELLGQAMQKALVEDGLFEDEAAAFVNTWKASYFRTPGLRLLYLLPREWTDQTLPLTLSVEAKVVRTMIGRIELVTPRQRKLLQEIARHGVAPEGASAAKANLAAEDVDAEAFAAYEALGRFRNAILLHELKLRPHEGLREFVRRHRLESYQVPRPEGE